VYISKLTNNAAYYCKCSTVGYRPHWIFPIVYCKMLRVITGIKLKLKMNYEINWNWTEIFHSSKISLPFTRLLWLLPRNQTYQNASDWMEVDGIDELVGADIEKSQEHGNDVCGWK